MFAHHFENQKKYKNSGILFKFDVDDISMNNNNDISMIKNNVIIFQILSRQSRK